MSIQTRCRSARRPTDPTSDVFEDLLTERDELIDGRPANGEQEIRKASHGQRQMPVWLLSARNPRKFMDHGWVTLNYNVARCSLIGIVPVESSRVGVTTRRRLIKYTYPREGSALVRKKKTTSLDSLKFASLVLQVHKDWILARSTTEQAWSAVRPPQIQTPSKRAGRTKPST